MLTSLAAYGIKTNEQKVLSYLLEHGSTLASLIAKATHLKRPTVYAILNSLQNTGLIKKEYREKTTYFSALAPAEIIRILKQQSRREFEKKEEAISLLEDELTSIDTITPKSFGNFTIESVESMQGLHSWLEKSLMVGNFVAIFNPQVELQGERINITEKFLEKTSQTKPHIREIMVSGPQADWYRAHINNPNHYIKEIQPSQNFIIDMIVANDTVVVLNYRNEKQIGIKIKESDFYQSMLTLFETLWGKL